MISAQEHQRAQCDQAGSDGCVFTSDTGGPIFISGLLVHFRQILRETGLPKLRFHALRHTAATVMLADGVPLVTVSKPLGYSSPSITAAIYAHALDESKSEVIAGLSKRLKRPRRHNSQQPENDDGPSA